MEAAGGSDFERVKSLWQTRATRAASREAAPTDADNGRAARASPLAAAAPRKASFLGAVSCEVAPAADSPGTPAPDEHFYAMEEPAPASSEASPEPSPASSASTMSVSPSRSTTPASVGVVSSVLRSLSDATALRKRSTSGGKAPHARGSGTTGEASPQDAVSHVSLSTLGVPSLPDMSGWKDKVKSYGAKSGPPPATKLKTLASISTTWKSMSAHSMKAALSEAANGPELARGNVHHVRARPKASAGHSALTSGSPYGELIVVEVVAARDLALEGDERPLAVVQFASVERRSRGSPRAIADSGSLAFNARFVFWVPSSPELDQQTVSIAFHRAGASSSSSSNDDIDNRVGEVHLSLGMPVNEVFADWFPLVRARDGARKGTALLGLRRLVLTSPTLLEAAQTLAARPRALSQADRSAFEATLPELWSGFTAAPGAPTADGAASSVVDTRLGKSKDALASKLSGLSRRLLGGAAASSASAGRRDVF